MASPIEALLQWDSDDTTIVGSEIYMELQHHGKQVRHIDHPEHHLWPAVRQWLRAAADARGQKWQAWYKDEWTAKSRASRAA